MEDDNGREDKSKSRSKSKSKLLEKSSPRNSRSKSKSKEIKKSLSRSRSKDRSRSRRRSGSQRRRSTSRRRRSNSRRKRSTSRKRRRSISRRRSRTRSRSRERRSPENDDGYRLHVGDLGEDCRKKDLEEIFMKYGPLKEIWLASYAPYYAFIVFRNRMDAEDASKGADGEKLSGHRMRVSLARPRQVGPRNRFVPDKYKGDSDRDYRGSDRRSNRY